ncbi:MAG: hypothetical protein HYY24_30055 [Verrucomicrobia bacterium]|nr:hypothetical protein [Verrucomicrobiota bacterium]
MSSPGSQWLSFWNRKLHIYLGLYFLVFLWLFSISGLLLNHSWRFTEFWEQRRQSTNEHRIELPQAATDLGRARDIMKQLGIAGEVEWTAAQPTTNRFDFRVARPGRMMTVKADFGKRIATVEETRVNAWGIVRMLHTFTGVQTNAVRAERDWLLTKLWSLSMDALAVGLIALVLSSLVMAVELRGKWLGAGIALGLGILVCGFFVFGLRWL